MSCKYEYNNITFNTPQELLQYARDNNIQEILDNLAPKPMTNDRFKKEVLIYLQDQDIVDKKQFPVGSGNYYIKKTQLGEDPKKYAPEETERKNLSKINDINQKYGHAVITTRQVGNGLVVNINTQTGLFDKSVEDIMDQSDTPITPGDVAYINENILTENTGQLAENAYLVAELINDPNLLNISEVIYRYRHLLNNVQTAILEDEEWQAIPEEAFQGADRNIVGGFYNAGDDTIYLNKKYLNTHSVEQVLNVIHEELFHALTVAPLHKLEKGLPMSAIEKEFATNIKNLLDYYTKHSASVKKTYRFSNTREFLVGMMLDKRFKTHLKEIDDQLAVKDGEKNFFQKMIDKFVNALLTFLKRSTTKPITTFDVLTTNYLNQYLDNIKEINNDGLVVSDDLFSTARDINSEQEALRTKIDLLSDKDKEEYLSKFKQWQISIKSLGNSDLNKYDQTIHASLLSIINQAKQFDSDKIDQVEYFFKFSNEISKIFNVLNKKAVDIIGDKSVSDKDKLVQWDRVISTARVYDFILNDMGSMRIELLADDPLAVQIDQIQSSRSNIEKGYNSSMVKILAPIMSEIARPASVKALAFFDEKIAFLKKSIDQANKANNKPRVKIQTEALEKAIKQRNAEYDITAENSRAWLEGRMGDADMISAFIEAAAVSSALPVSVLDKWFKDHIAEITSEVLNLQNTLQTELDNYSKETGLSINNLKAFYEPMLERYNEVIGIDEEGKPITKATYTMKNQFKMDYVGKLQEFIYRSGDLTKKLADRTLSQDKRDEYNESLQKNKEKRLQFVRDYMERPYHDKVHDAMDLYYRDLGGFTAQEEFSSLYDEIRDLEDKIGNTVDQEQFDALSDILEEKEFRIKELRSMYGKVPGSKEYKIAELMNERDKKMNEYFEFVLTDSGRARFEQAKSETDADYESGKITQAYRNFWYQRNTQNALSKGYWDAKMKIIGQMNDILGQLNATKEKNKDVGDLYNDLRDLTKIYRDSEDIIDGTKFNIDQTAKVKEIEEKIEELKSKLPNMFGLTKAEKIEMSNAHDRLVQIEESLQGYLSKTVRTELVIEEEKLKERIDEISSKKKQFGNRKLLDKYFRLMKELGDLDTNDITHYYDKTYDEQLAIHADNQSLDGMGTKFYDDGVKYENAVGIEWTVSNKRVKGPATVIDEAAVKRAFQMKKAKDTFQETDWYKKNHLLRTVWVKNPDYDPENQFEKPGDWQEISDPLYIWKQTTPTDKSYILQGEPSIKYKKRRIKDEFRNKKYRTALNGFNVPKIEGAKDDRFINKEYTDLKNASDSKNKAIFRALTFLTDTYHDAQEELPIHARMGYNPPSIRKSAEERLLGSTIGKHVGNLFDSVSQYVRGAKDELVKNEQDKDLHFGYINNIGGMVPIKFIGDIDIEDQSIDLFRTIGMFKVAALQRRQLVKAYPFAKAMYDVVSDKFNTPVKKKNGIIESTARKYLKKGTEVAKRIDGQSQMAAQINEMIRTTVFGEKMKDQPGAKQISAISGLSAKFMLGGNVISMVQNFANAKIQSILETESKVTKNFNMREWFTAEYRYNSNILNLMKDLGKYGNKHYINQFIDYFGGMNFDILTKFDKTLAYGALKEGLGSVLMPTEMAEKQLGSVLFISMGLNTKVDQTIDGVTKKIPLYEAFINDSKTGEFKLKEGVELSKEQKEDFMGRLNNAARRINGEYGKLDTVTGQKVIAGRLLMFMNRFFVPFFMHRFGNGRWSINEGHAEPGFWRVFFSTMGTDIKNYQFNIVANWKYYDDTQKAAIKKTVTEMAVSIAVMGLISALGGGDDAKDINKNSTLVNNMIYILKGIKRQNEQFMLVPGLGLDDVVQRIKNPLPIAGKVVQSFRLLQDIGYLAGYPLGLSEDKDIMYTRKTGWHRKGDIRMFTDVARLLGAPNKYQQLVHPDIAIKNLNSFRIR